MKRDNNNKAKRKELIMKLRRRKDRPEICHYYDAKQIEESLFVQNKADEAT